MTPVWRNDSQRGEEASQGRPSAELLLGALKTISISVVEVQGRIQALLSPLTEVQKRLLDFWDLPPDLYEKVADGFPEPP